LKIERDDFQRGFSIRKMVGKKKIKIATNHAIGTWSVWWVLGN
jgi:hypothetical protein